MYGTGFPLSTRLGRFSMVHPNVGVTPVSKTTKFCWNFNLKFFTFYSWKFITEVFKISGLTPLTVCVNWVAYVHIFVLSTSIHDMGPFFKMLFHRRNYLFRSWHPLERKVWSLSTCGESSFALLFVVSEGPGLPEVATRSLPSSGTSFFVVRRSHGTLREDIIYRTCEDRLGLTVSTSFTILYLQVHVIYRVSSMRGILLCLWEWCYEKSFRSLVSRVKFTEQLTKTTHLLKFYVTHRFLSHRPQSSWTKQRLRWYWNDTLVPIWLEDQRSRDTLVIFFTVEYHDTLNLIDFYLSCVVTRVQT